ncbi:MAG: hypothetical protein JSW52_04860 [Candidatus Coatesbacteria bacterium]|nr:MAG: hypothetical protein JSW52_04860 [Candidatus Coatesbacteria bacterium]
MLINGNCSSLIIITSPSDTGYRGRCIDPFANSACLITEDEKKKCEEGFFCCYFSELYSEYHYFCHRDIWRRFIKPHENGLDLILFCYLSGNKELVASGFFGDIASGSAYRDINAGRFVKDVEGDYRYIVGAQDGSVRFPYDILLPKLNSISPAGFIRTVSDEEMISVLKKARSVIERIENSADAEAVKRIDGAIDVISETVRAAAPYRREGAVSVELADWLRELFDDTEEIPVTDLKTQVSELQDRAATTEDPRHFLVASKLQFRNGDYKYVLSLANFCYFYGHKLKKGQDYGGAKRAFAEAVKLYLLDPVEKNWKKDYIEKCVGEFLKLTAFDVADEYGEEQSFEDFFTVMTDKVGLLEDHIPIEDLGRRIEIQYYSSRLERFWDRGDTEGYIAFFTGNVAGRPFEDSIKQALAARYYQLLAKDLEQQGTDDTLTKAAEYRRVAANKQRNRSDGSFTVSAHEDLIEMNKDLALVAYRQGDISKFLERIDEAIDTARRVYESEPTRRRRENVYFLEGLKYRNLAKKSDVPAGAEVAGGQTARAHTAIEGFKTGVIDERIISAVLSSDGTSGFAEALDITRKLLNETERAILEAPSGVSEGFPLSVLSVALSFCLVDEVGEEELWEFIGEVAECRTAFPGSPAVRIAEVVAAWYLCRIFGLAGARSEQDNLRSAVRRAVENALGRGVV